ncbi:MAG: hypothetical protein IJ418_01690 [Clostridia bacterium]|nr:hypothetical protein [Clostridia bacterium]
MAKTIDLFGKTFGRLTVLCLAPRPEYSTRTGAWWLCRCSCGRETVVYGEHLRTGSTRSCGCLRKELAAARQRKGAGGC